MNEYLKHYHIRMRTMSPVFIGSGTVIGNREYIYLQNQHKVIIPDLMKMYTLLAKNGHGEEFQEYMLSEKFPLGSWLSRKGYRPAHFASFRSYELDAGDYFMEDPRSGRIKPPQDIQSFVKDPYGMPYIPGSSLKGMLRTALLVWIAANDESRFREALSNIENARTDRAVRSFLSKEAEALEQQAFHTLDRQEKRRADAVNSIMSGLIVSDSSPLSTNDLTLSQKIDLSLEGTENRMPLLRETIRPNVRIEFDLTIDEKLFPYTISDILEALELFNHTYYESFGKAFGRGNPEPGICWLGGGAGFATKTVLYALFPKKQAVEIADQVFWNTINRNYPKHHHEKDLRLGFSPHMYKCTRYEGRLCDMGMLKMESAV